MPPGPVGNTRQQGGHWVGAFKHPTTQGLCWDWDAQHLQPPCWHCDPRPAPHSPRMPMATCREAVKRPPGRLTAAKRRPSEREGLYYTRTQAIALHQMQHRPRSPCCVLAAPCPCLWPLGSCWGSAVQGRGKARLRGGRQRLTIEFHVTTKNQKKSAHAATSVLVSGRALVTIFFGGLT